MKRGEVWVANMNPARGTEVGKVRPALVIQADWLTDQGSANIVVLPLSTRLDPSTSYFRPILAARDGLRLDSQILVDQPRTVDRRRFGPQALARLTDTEMAKVDESLRVALGMGEETW